MVRTSTVCPSNLRKFFLFTNNETSYQLSSILTLNLLFFYSMHVVYAPKITQLVFIYNSTREHVLVKDIKLMNGTFANSLC